MLFDVVNFILCGVKKKRGRGVNIIHMYGINCVGSIYGTDVHVGGDNEVRDASVF